MAKKMTPSTATPADPLTYVAWKAAAALQLARRHGITSVLEKQWRDWFSKGMTPADAADRVAAEYQAMRPPVDRTRGEGKR